MIDNDYQIYEKKDKFTIQFNSSILYSIFSSINSYSFI